jgi:hypothetical protein
MTPKEKAKELLNKFRNVALLDDYECNLCALISVDEILDIDCFDMSEEHFDNHIEYWNKVKQEIQEL